MPLLVGSVESISVSEDVSEYAPIRNVTAIDAMAMTALMLELLTLRQTGTPAGVPLLFSPGV